MNEAKPTPARLAVQLLIYFAIVIGSISILLQVRPDVVMYLPLGGSDALASNEIVEMLDPESSEVVNTEVRRGLYEQAAANVGHLVAFVVGHLVGTIIVMLPITWTYRAMNFDAGFSKTFVRALIVLPICATTIVLLIQDSLALAFGLAALVAAVRFRVALDDAMDGIFIFAAICVGLAGGIGYVGVACVMSVFFCFSNVTLWMTDYGRNPVDDLRRRKRREKLNPPADAGRLPE